MRWGKSLWKNQEDTKNAVDKTPRKLNKFQRRTKNEGVLDWGAEQNQKGEV